MTEKRNDVIQIRVSPDEKERIGKNAGRASLSVSEWVRWAALNVKVEPNIEDTTNELTRAIVNLDAEGVARVTRKVIPAAEATLRSMAENPAATIKLTPEQQARLDEIERCPYTAKQLSGRSGLPVAVCQHQIDRGTWRTLL